MKAVLLLQTRTVFSDSAFAELVLWKVPKPVAGSTHEFKYRLAYVVNDVCVVRYDNEVGKGDHRHIDEKEIAYAFTTPDKLIVGFRRDIARWNHEDHHS